MIAPLRDRSGRATRRSPTRSRAGIPITVTQASPFSIDENLFGRSIEAGILEDPWDGAAGGPYAAHLGPGDRAGAASRSCSASRRACRSSLDGEELPLAELIAQLNGQAGAYGIGRIDMIENRAVGIKSREVYEAPAAIALIEAHKALEDVVLTKAELRSSAGSRSRWTELVYDGLWFCRCARRSTRSSTRRRSS